MRDGRPGGPVVVLTYAHAGVQHLLSHLVGRPDLACTSGTGVLPLCDQAVTTWRQAEGRLVGSGGVGGPGAAGPSVGGPGAGGPSVGGPSAGGPGGGGPGGPGVNGGSNGGPNGADAPISPLAAASVRALATAMITAILARAGKRRWCETAVALPGSAGTFLRLFPDTRFLCLHRSCPGVIRESLAASPWGLSGPAFAPFVAAHPSSTVAALAAYWAGHAGPLLDFERDHPEACCRVRHEDLVADAAGESARVAEFLGLDGGGPVAPAPPAPRSADEPGGVHEPGGVNDPGRTPTRGPAGETSPGHDPGRAHEPGPAPTRGPAGEASPGHEPGPADEAGFRAMSVRSRDDGPSPGGLPVSQLPSALLAQVNEVAARLGYSPIEGAG